MLEVCDAVTWGFPCFPLPWPVNVGFIIFCRWKKNPKSSKFKSFDVQWHFYRCCLFHWSLSVYTWLASKKFCFKKCKLIYYSFTNITTFVLVSWVKLFEFQAYSALNFHWNHNLTTSIWKRHFLHPLHRESNPGGIHALLCLLKHPALHLYYSVVCVCVPQDQHDLA